LGGGVKWGGERKGGTEGRKIGKESKIERENGGRGRVVVGGESVCVPIIILLEAEY
jgi:hypothetical protein